MVVALKNLLDTVQKKIQQRKPHLSTLKLCQHLRFLSPQSTSKPCGTAVTTHALWTWH